MGMIPSLYFLYCEMSSFHDSMENIMTADKNFSGCTDGVTSRNITGRESRSISKIYLYLGEDKYLLPL